MIDVNFVDTLRRWTKEDQIPNNKKQEVTLWKKDYKYLQFIITTDDEIEVEVEAKSQTNVKVYSLDSTLAFIGHAGWYARNPKGIMPTGPKVRVDDILVPYKPIKVKEYKCFFVKIETDENSKDETISIDVNLGGVNNILEIETKVVDKTFIDPKDYKFTVEYWHHPYNVAEYYKVEPFSKEHLDILKEHQLLYKSIGGKGVICTLLDEVWGGQTYSKNEIRYPSMVKWIKTKEGFKFDYSILDLWISSNISWGLDEKFICYSMMPWSSKMRYYDEAKGKYKVKIVPCQMKKKYAKMWTPFMQDFVKHLDEKGWFDKVYIGFDERNNMQDVLDFVASFKNKEGKSFKISASFNNYISNKKCLDRIDSAAVGLDEIEAHKKEYIEIVKERSLQGKDTMLYTACEHYPNSFALSMPAESYWSIIYALATGNNGFLRWAYDAWVENPLEDTTHWSFQAGDCFLIYPAKEGITPSMSYRLLKLDEAVRDVNKLLLGNKQEDIEKLKALVRMDYSYKIAYDSSWGVSIRKTKWADEKAKEDISRDVLKMQEIIENSVNN